MSLELHEKIVRLVDMCQYSLRVISRSPHWEVEQVLPDLEEAWGSLTAAAQWLEEGDPIRSEGGVQPTIMFRQAA